MARENETDTETWEEEGGGKVEAETQVMWLQVSEGQKPPEARGGREGCSPW